MEDSWPFPLLVPLSRTHYAGYVNTANQSAQQYAFELKMARPDEMSEAHVSCCPGLGELLGPNGLLVVQQRLRGSSSVASFLVELQDLMHRAEKERREYTPAHRIQSSTASAALSVRLVQELDEIWDHVESIEKSLNSLQLQFRDSHGRKHLITVQLADDYPNTPPWCSMEIPEPVTLFWRKGSSLKDVLTQYSKAAESFIELWKHLDDLDQHTWILEPDKPSYSTPMRRIALENHCSLQIELDKRQPGRMPHCKIFGSDRKVSLLRNKLHQNFSKWEESVLIRHNLERILQIQFPTRPAPEEEEDMHCPICDMYKLESSIPDQTCENEKCPKVFHQQCLYEWLRTISSSSSFDTVFGKCPNCSHDISVQSVR